MAGVMEVASARSSLHPDKFDQITADGQRWPVTALASEAGHRRLQLVEAFGRVTQVPILVFNVGL